MQALDIDRVFPLSGASCARHPAATPYKPRHTNHETRCLP